MSEASGRAEMERRLIERSLQDEDFRERLLSEPEATIERELGVGLPEEVAGGGNTFMCTYTCPPPEGASAPCNCNV